MSRLYKTSFTADKPPHPNCVVLGLSKDFNPANKKKIIELKMIYGKIAKEYTTSENPEAFHFGTNLYIYIYIIHITVTV